MKTENPNSKQIGGCHYQGAAQHWDWVADCYMGYHAGCATKYLVRSLKKHKLPVGDWEKALHFVQKLRSLPSSGSWFFTALRLLRLWVRFTKEHAGVGVSTKELQDSLDIPSHTTKIMHLLSIWVTRQDLDRITQLIKKELVDLWSESGTNSIDQVQYWEDELVG